MDFFVECFLVFQKGGPVMYLIVLCSLIVAAIGVERFMYYKTVETDMSDFVKKLTSALERGDGKSAVQLCRNTGGVAAKVAAKGLECYQKGNSRLESVLEGEASLAAAKLRENLNHLDTIVTMAPLLGLLGTVVGMINSFSVLNLKNGQPLAITGGVGEALVATASGLCVAIFAMVVYSYFNHRFDKIITDIEAVCILLVEHAEQVRQVEPVKQEKHHEIA